jgi:hypothetical protein
MSVVLQRLRWPANLNTDVVGFQATTLAQRTARNKEVTDRIVVGAETMRT